MKCTHCLTLEEIIEDASRHKENGSEYRNWLWSLSMKYTIPKVTTEKLWPAIVSMLIIKSHVKNYFSAEVFLKSMAPKSFDIRRMVSYFFDRRHTQKSNLEYIF